MRRCFSALSFSLLIALSVTTLAEAADFNSGASRATDADQWNGVYLGAHGSKVMSNGGVDLGEASGFLIPLDISNGLFVREESKLRGTIGVGLTAGYNQAYGKYVFGIEGDLTWANLDASHHRERVDPNPIVPFFGQNVVSDYITKFDNIGTFRLRAGVSVNKSLLYVTGGVAVSTVRNEFQVAIPGLGYSSPDWSESGLAWGYAVGAGIEHKLTENLSVKAEGLYIDLEDREVEGVDPVAFPGEYISYEFDNSLAIARVGLNYTF